MTEQDLTEVQPEGLGLGEVIAHLKREDPNKRLPIGFKHPHSYRGYYDELAFEVAHDVTVREMLADAESALGATFQGWKGGDYEMKDWTSCWLVTEEGNSGGETIGALFLALLLAAGAVS
jgi:hypothetical protein